MAPKQLLSSKLVLALLVILLAFLGNVKFRQWRVQTAIDKEKQILTQQADEQNKKKIELSESLSYLNSSDFRERVARQQLGLKKDGEVVFDFSENPGLAGGDSRARPAEERSNFQKWWDYFVNP